MKAILVLLLSILSLGSLASSQNLIINETIKYLASDSLEGRRAGTAGNKLASSYLENKLKGFGLAPLGKEHIQDFTIFTKMIKTTSNE